MLQEHANQNFLARLLESKKVCEPLLPLGDCNVFRLSSVRYRGKGLARAGRFVEQIVPCEKAVCLRLDPKKADRPGPLT